MPQSCRFTAKGCPIKEASRRTRRTTLETAGEVMSYYTWVGYVAFLSACFDTQEYYQ